VEDVTRPSLCILGRRFSLAHIELDLFLSLWAFLLRFFYLMV
jgi:hypothetical protein